MCEEVGNSLARYAEAASLIHRTNCLQGFNWDLSLEYKLGNLKKKRELLQLEMFRYC